MSTAVSCRSVIGVDGGVRERRFEQYAPLARRLAGRYHNPHEPLEDLFQVAYVGLLGAIDRFDPERGIPFRSSQVAECGVAGDRR